ncbi:MAG: hypothetical protein HON53_03525 [Planctomycetaceae bacterium]|nr:hypothetical protein [Planctomycetaceae bacterium]
MMKDPSDPDPQRRYKMIAWTHEKRPAKGVGYRTFFSPDGLNWKQHGTHFASGPHGDVGDVITGYWDARTKQYVAFPKQHFSPWRGHTRRLFYTTTSKDFTNWSDPVLSWKTDLRDDAGSMARLDRVRPALDRPDNPKLMRTEFYGIGAYSAESCTIGFPWVLTVNNDARYGNQEGPQEVQLAVSRDLVNWERPFRTPVIPHGDLNAWDATYHQTASYAIRVGDEIWLYYGGANYTHGTPALYRPDLHPGRGTKYTNSIGLVTWKLDRFVSIDSPAEGGTLTTISMTFSGKRLVLNAATKQGGSIVVELCDAAGRPLKDFSRSAPFSGDDIRAEIVFGEKIDLSSLAGQPISLRFHMKNAELYSFAFRD